MSEAAWSDDELLRMDTTTATDELDIKRDPIGAFTDHMERFGRETGYVEQMATTLAEFQAFIRDQFGEHLCNIDNSHVVAFNDHLQAEYRDHYYTITTTDGTTTKQIDITDRTRHDYLRRLSTFYNWLVEDGVVSTNPARTALRQFPESEFHLAPPDRPRIEIEEMAAFLSWLDDERVRAFIMFLLKTGARLGEAINVDLCCLHLDHPVYEQVLDRADVDLHPKVADKPDAVYLDPGFQAGTEVRGTTREAGSKRQREGGTIIPVDGELKTALIAYLLVRRPATNSPPQATPLFTKTTAKGQDRITTSTTAKLLTRSNGTKGVLYEYGWWEPDADTAEKVTAHYFRHYFTHNHRANSGVWGGALSENVIAYVRGDAPDRSTARGHNYRHEGWNDWESQVKEPYLEGVYQFDTFGHTAGETR